MKSQGRSLVERLSRPLGGVLAIVAVATVGFAAGESLPSREALVGQEEVLVVDDEPMLRDTCRQLLSGLGYQVRTASDGLAALDLLDRAEYHPRVVVLDVVMPGLSGVPLLKEILKRLPSVPVILISGYYRDVIGRELLAAGARQLVPKPFRIEDLAGAMRRALDTK
jgi:CheY-like chemotaxis protein